MPPTATEYQRLLELRTGLRRFLHWSEEEARSHGVTPAHHQLLLAIKGHPGTQAPTVSALAKALVLRPNSVVGLIDRAQSAGLVRRRRDPSHPSLVRLYLTAKGEDRLAALTEAHLAELTRLAPAMEALWAAAGDLPAAKRRPAA
jgi:DNA-binding MarR family transcriptional regulator